MSTELVEQVRGQAFRVVDALNIELLTAMRRDDLYHSLAPLNETFAAVAVRFGL
jgi:hypothetical protein